MCAQDLEHCLTGCPEVALNAADLHGLDHHARQAERHLGVWMWVWGGGAGERRLCGIRDEADWQRQATCGFLQEGRLGIAITG